MNSFSFGGEGGYKLFLLRYFSIIPSPSKERVRVRFLFI
jgi:hypothetical protein